MIKKYLSAYLCLLAGVVLISLLCIHNAAADKFDIKQKVSKLRVNAPGLKTKVAILALTAFQKAEQEGISHSPILTVVDYSLPSNEKRLWVFNIKSNKLLFYTYVAQGKNTGMKLAKHFSDLPGSRESSLGLFKTGKSYYGSDGYSLRLYGLEPKINGNAYKRDIVVHSAWYMSPDFIEQQGRAGRSFGCFAVNKKIIKPLVDTIKDNSLLFAYYPQPSWISSSKFL